MLQKVEITELRGVNRNAVEGVTQVVPVELRGFDLNKAGGYYAAFAQSGTPTTSGVSGSVTSHDAYGVVLLDDETFVFDDVLVDFSSASPAGKRVYLVPRVGVVSHARTVAEDEYDLGTFVEDVQDNFGDVFRQDSASVVVTTSSSVSSFSVQFLNDATAASGQIDAGSYKVMALWLKPTAQGLLVYDTVHATISLSGTERIEIQSAGFLPAGYGAKTYLAKEGDGRFSQYFPNFAAGSGGTPENQPTVFSDGEGTFVAEIGTFASGSLSVEPTNNAIINFCSKLACVEPHNRRVWSRAAATPFVGPFIEGYSPLVRFEVNYTISPNEAVNEEFFETSASGLIAVTSTSNPQFSLSTRFDDGIFFEDAIPFSSSVADVPAQVGSASHVLDIVRENDASGVNLAFGVEATTTTALNSYSSSLAFSHDAGGGAKFENAIFSEDLDIVGLDSETQSIAILDNDTLFVIRARGAFSAFYKLAGNNWSTESQILPPLETREARQIVNVFFSIFANKQIFPDAFQVGRFTKNTLLVGAYRWGLHENISQSGFQTSRIYQPGRIFVYNKTDGSFVLDAEVRHPDYDIDLGLEGFFGSSVDIFIQNDGMVDGEKKNFGKLIATDNSPSAIDNEFITIGQDTNDDWVVFFYRKVSNVWTLEQRVRTTASEPIALTWAGNKLFVTYNDTPDDNIVYERSGNTWSVLNFGLPIEGDHLAAYDSYMVIEDGGDALVYELTPTSVVLSQTLSGTTGPFAINGSYLFADGSNELFVFNGSEWVPSGTYLTLYTRNDGVTKSDGLPDDLSENYFSFSQPDFNGAIWVREIDEINVDVTREYDWRVVYNDVSYSVNYETVSTSHVLTEGGFNNVPLDYRILQNRSLDFTQSGTTVDVQVIDSDGVTVESSASITGVSGSYASGTTVEAFAYEAASYSTEISTRVTAEFYESQLNSDAGTQVRIDPDDYSAGDSFTDASTSIVWNLDRAGVSKGQILLQDLAAANIARLNTPSTIVYSDVGYVNFASTIDQFLQLELIASDEITALVSTPGGLVVFADNEAFLVRGDPSLPQSFSAQRFSSTIGCDDGVRPGRVGGTVFPIWKGRLYSMTLGMGDVDFGSGVQEIGAPIYDPEDPFVQVIGEPRTRQVLVRTNNGRVYRYSTDAQQWMNDVFDNEDGLTFLLPNADDNGSRYLVGTDLKTAKASSGDSPYVEWQDLDLGSKGMRKQWRRVRAYFGDDYVGTPTLEYEVGSSSGTITGSEEGAGWFTFTLPNGLVNEKMARLRITMVNASFGDEFEPPVVIEFVERYSRR